MGSCKIQPQVTQSKLHDWLPHLPDSELCCLSLVIPGECELDCIGYDKHLKANHIKAMLLLSSMVASDDILIRDYRKLSNKYLGTLQRTFLLVWVGWFLLFGCLVFVFYLFVGFWFGVCFVWLGVLLLGFVSFFSLAGLMISHWPLLKLLWCLILQCRKNPPCPQWVLHSIVVPLYCENKLLLPQQQQQGNSMCAQICTGVCITCGTTPSLLHLFNNLI